MSTTRTYGTGMPYQGQTSVGKHEASVDSGVSAGRCLNEMAPTTILASFTADTHSEHLEIFRTPVEEPRIPAEEPRTPQNLETPEQPQVKTSHVTLGYLGIHEKPEEFRPTVVYGKINGYTARIMLNSGCSTYVLSTDFAQENSISCYFCNPIPVELAVQSVGQFNLETQTKKLFMKVGSITQSKALYVLPLPSCDAIFGMPFLNDKKLTTNSEQGTVSIDDMMLPLTKDLNEPIQISLISRSQFKAEFQRNVVSELYLATIKIAKKNKLSEFPNWIKKEFSDIFLDGLPPGMPPKRKVVHDIPLYPDSLPQFRGIFHLSQMELQELRKQLDGLLRDGKISRSEERRVGKECRSR